MNQATRTIHVSRGSDLDHLLDAFEDAPIQLERDGVHYQLVRVSQKPREKSPSDEQIERAIEGIRKASGVWSDVDADAFKTYIRDRRRTANRSSIEL